MIQILRLILTQMVLSLRSRAGLQVENLALRHQIAILKRTAPKRARLTKTDRLIFTWLLRLWPKSAQLVRIVRPKTLVRWHREGFRVYWRWKSRRRGGRPKAPNEVRALIRQMGAQHRPGDGVDGKREGERAARRQRCEAGEAADMADPAHEQGPDHAAHGEAAEIGGAHDAHGRGREGLQLGPNRHDDLLQPGAQEQDRRADQKRGDGCPRGVQAGAPKGIEFRPGSPTADATYRC